MFGVLTLLLVAQLIAVTDSINVLVFAPTVGKSHVKFMAHIADTLSEAGHNVTLLVPINDAYDLKQLHLKSTKYVYFVEHDEIMSREYIPAEENMEVFWTVDPRTEDIKETYYPFHDSMRKSCGNLLRNQKAFEEMKKRNFDVAIAEPLNVCGLAYFHKLGIEKTILSSSVVHFDFILPHIGEPLELSYVPILVGDGTDNMNIIERYENQRIYENMRYAFDTLHDDEMTIYRKYFGDDTPDWRELLSSASLYFTNSNPYVDFPRPVIQKTIAIGGISVDMEHIRSQKLTKEWEEVLEKRNKTMLISFGSLVLSSEMPENYRHNLLETIKSLPDVTFIWKYESDDISFADGVDNIYFSKWVPQTALLADYRLTAFLTHGGLGSTNEIAYCGKPALMIPMFFDQMRNANMLARHHGAIALNKKKLGDFEVLRKSVRDIIYDESYAKNAEKLAELITNQPDQPKDLVVKHTEFLAKYGPFPQMDPYVRHLNFFQRTFLDIYLIQAVSLIVVISLSAIFLRFLLSKVFAIRTKKTV